MLPFGKVMVYLAFNCNLNAGRGRPLLSQWDQTASGQKRAAVPKSLRDYSGVIRRNATRYLVPGAILLQVVGEVEGPLECDRQLLRRCLTSSRLAADNVSPANRSKD